MGAGLLPRLPLPLGDRMTTREELIRRCLSWTCAGEGSFATLKPVFSVGRWRMRCPLCDGSYAMVVTGKPMSDLEPVAWMWQNDETGRLLFLTADDLDPGKNWSRIGSVYAAPPTQAAQQNMGENDAQEPAHSPLRSATAPLGQRDNAEASQVAHPTQAADERAESIWQQIMVAAENAAASSFDDGRDYPASQSENWSPRTRELMSKLGTLVSAALAAKGPK